MRAAEARLRRSRAAVLGEVGEEAVHLREIGPVDQVPAMALLRDEPGDGQLLQVERERGRRDREVVGDPAGSRAGLTGDHEGTKDPQPVRLRQSGQRLEYGCFFHYSITLELCD